VTNNKYLPGELTVFKIIWQARVRIIILTLAIGILTGIISLFFANTYSSTAALLIKQPELPVEGESPPPSVETLRTMVEADSTKQELFSSLTREGSLPEEMDFRDFRRKLSTDILRQRDREKTPLPMLQLTAITSDSELSSRIANRWVKIVLEKTRDTHSGGMNELGQFISNLFSQANQALNAAEEAYTKGLLDSDLEGQKLRLTLLRESRMRSLSTYLKLSEEISRKESLSNELQRQLEGGELDGIWLGEIYARTEISGEELSNPPQSEGGKYLQRLNANLRKNEKEMAEFEEKSNLQFKEMQLKNKGKQLEQISSQIVTTQNRLALLSSQFAELKKNLEGILPKTVLKKTITDEAAWNAFLSGSFPDDNLPVMAMEESNPIYVELSTDLLKKSAEIQGLRGQVSYYGEKQEALREEVSRLVNNISSLKSTHASYVEAITRDQKMFVYLAEQYNKTRQERANLSTQVLELKASHNSLETELEYINNQIKELETIIFSWEDKLSALERTVESQQQIRDSLAARAGEISMLNVSLQDVSRSGIAIFYNAEANPIKVGPQRGRIVIAAMLATLLISSGVIAFLRLVQDS